MLQSVLLAKRVVDTLVHAFHLVRAQACHQSEGTRTRLRRCTARIRRLTFTYGDDRFAYGEQRFVTLGLLAGVPVSVAHTESDDEIRIISFRKATDREARRFFSEVQN